jgi:hypothetical protein
MCRLSFINVVCEILKLICGLYKCMLCFSHGKAKEKKKNWASPSAWQVALREENIKRKKEGGFPECLASGTRGRKYKKKNRRGLPRVLGHLALGEGYF